MLSKTLRRRGSIVGLFEEDARNVMDDAREMMSGRPGYRDRNRAIMIDAIDAIQPSCAS